MKKILVLTLVLTLVLGMSVVFADSPGQIYQSLTDKTLEDLKQMREEGKTLWEAAEEDGVLEEFKDAVYKDAEEKTNQLVEEGKITQERADEMLAKLKEELKEGTFCKPIRPFGGRRGFKGALTEEEIQEHIQQVKEKMAELVEEGKMTQEEADERLENFEKRIEDGDFGRGHGLRRELTEEEKQEHIQKAKEKLDTLVEEGKITQEKADKILEDIEKRIEEGRAGRGMGRQKQGRMKDGSGRGFRNFGKPNANRMNLNLQDL